MRGLGHMGSSSPPASIRTNAPARVGSERRTTQTLTAGAMVVDQNRHARTAAAGQGTMHARGAQLTLRAPAGLARGRCEPPLRAAAVHGHKAPSIAILFELTPTAGRTCAVARSPL